MRKIIIGLVILLFFPLAVSAAGVGFVPASGIWLARTSLADGELARVYTVVVNNDYYALEGEVGFYDNNELIDKAQIKRLPRESAQQLRVFWQPTPGAHSLSARFVSVTTIDEQGTRIGLDTGGIGGAVGASLMVTDKNTGFVVPLQDITGQGKALNIGQALMVEVERQGGQIFVGAPAPTGAADGVVLGVKEVTAATKNLFAQISSTVHSNSLLDAFNKNREALEGAGKVVDAVSSTAGTVGRVYSGTQTALVRVKTYYATVQSYADKAAPYAERAQPAWLFISDNNNPIRIAIIFVGLFLLYWMVKRRFRRGRQRFKD
ncbi:MAG: hypothetical protein EXS55_01260 [Candidatus Magasanikbacteria bacterium]|nr:hypothetical protein [Candidatus Magasanikbacteria bacterium]